MPLLGWPRPCTSVMGWSCTTTMGRVHSFINCINALRHECLFAALGWYSAKLPWTAVILYIPNKHDIYDIFQGYIFYYWSYASSAILCIFAHAQITIVHVTVLSKGSYSLFTLSMPGSQNRKYYIIGMHVYYILLVYHANAISTSCSCVICCHCLLSFRLLFLLPIISVVNPLFSILYCYLLHYWYSS